MWVKMKRKPGNFVAQWNVQLKANPIVMARKNPTRLRKAVRYVTKNLSRKFASSNNEPEQFHPSFLSHCRRRPKQRKAKIVFVIFSSPPPLPSSLRHFNILTMMWPIFRFESASQFALQPARLTFNIQLLASFHFSNIYHISWKPIKTIQFEWRRRAIAEFFW
jgi:hypothetical protein